MSGWWRRNAVGLGVVAVLIPATFVIVAAQESSDLSRATEPVVVSEGDTAEYVGATFGPARASFLIDDDAAPPGTRVLTATVPVDPDPADPVACTTPTLAEVGGRQRQWIERSQDLGRGFDGDLTICFSDETEPYEMFLEFLVPDDATGPFTVDVDAVEGRPKMLRLQVQP